MYSENSDFDQPISQLPKKITSKKWYQRWWGILILIFVAIILTFIIAIGFYIGQMYLLLKSGEITPEQIFGVSQTIESNNEFNQANINEPKFGPINAKVVIVEFADFTCVACKQEYSVIKQLQNDYGDKVQFIFRDYPAFNDRPLSLVAAIAGNCAREQGKFWEMHDLLFQMEGDLTNSILNTYATQIGLNVLQFQNCITSEKYLTDVEKDIQAGLTAGVSGTPTFFVNGKKIQGAIPFATFEKVITTELSK